MKPVDVPVDSYALMAYLQVILETQARILAEVDEQKPQPIDVYTDLIDRVEKTMAELRQQKGRLSLFDGWQRPGE